MAKIRPFCALRFTQKAGALEELTAPPYDVISPEERTAFTQKNNYNIVYITLPEQKKDDRSKFVKYARSAARLNEWLEHGILKVEEKPCFYRYSQEFTLPGSSETFFRTALIAILKTEPYEKGVVLPHEQTFPKHKEDRLRLLEATHTQTESIYGLYDDEKSELHQFITSCRAEVCITLKTDDHVKHTLEKIEDSETIQNIVEKMESKKIWIADGHHRYETSRNFREALGEKQEEVAADYMLIALSSMKDPGLVLLPTHRILSEISMTLSDLQRAIAQDYQVETCKPEDLEIKLTEAQVNKTIAFGIAQGSEGIFAQVLEKEKLLNKMDPMLSDKLKHLDVTILHENIFKKHLGLKEGASMEYTRDLNKAIRGAKTGKTAFLMNPPSVQEMQQVALNGDKMPQKSTYYFPKLLSGLFLWSLSDFK